MIPLLAESTEEIIKPAMNAVEALVNLGSVGAVAAVMYITAKRFMDETVKQMSSRIDSLEKRSDACEQDRMRLHAEMIRIAQER